MKYKIKTMKYSSILLLGFLWISAAAIFTNQQITSWKQQQRDPDTRNILFFTISFTNFTKQYSFHVGGLVKRKWFVTFMKRWTVVFIFLVLSIVQRWAMKDTKEKKPTSCSLVELTFNCVFFLFMSSTNNIKTLALFWFLHRLALFSLSFIRCQPVNQNNISFCLGFFFLYFLLVKAET